MSGLSQGAELDLSAVNGKLSGNEGIEHAAELVAFVEAVMSTDPAALVRCRNALRAVLTDAAFVDACAVIGAFNIVDRIADSTGIPLDDRLLAMSGEVRADLDLARFASSANTPGVK